MSMTYAQYALRLSQAVGPLGEGLNWIIAVPAAIDYAEGRIYRELNMLNADVTDATASTTNGSRKFTLPTSIGTFLILNSLNIITPASTAPDNGTCVPLVPTSKEFLDVAWPSSANSGVPQYFSYISQNTYLSGAQAQPQVIFGPWPNGTYTVEVTGKIQPTPLSSSNTSTWLTTNLPDLFMAASMIYLFESIRTAGGQSLDPNLVQAWETQYQALRVSADQWEARKRFAGASWTAKQLEPVSQPQRG